MNSRYILLGIIIWSNLLNCQAQNNKDSVFYYYHGQQIQIPLSKSEFMLYFEDSVSAQRSGLVSEKTFNSPTMIHCKRINSNYDSTVATLKKLQGIKSVEPVIGHDKTTADFQAAANGGTTIVSGQSTMLYANDIMEPATYEWFDEQGNSVGAGLTCNVTPAQTTTYTLAVTADADGYRAYDQVTVTVREGWVTSISPNPANGQVTVSYRLTANVASAVIQILNGNGQVVGSYPVSGSSSAVTGNVVINTSSLAAGSYSVRLVSNRGNIFDSKTLVIR